MISIFIYFLWRGIFSLSEWTAGNHRDHHWAATMTSIRQPSWPALGHHHDHQLATTMTTTRPPSGPLPWPTPDRHHDHHQTAIMTTTWPPPPERHHDHHLATTTRPPSWPPPGHHHQWVGWDIVGDSVFLCTIQVPQYQRIVESEING